MAQPITSLIALSTYDLLSFKADIILSSLQEELVERLSSQMFNAENGKRYTILVGDQASYGYLVNQMAVSTSLIVMYAPTDTLLERLDELDIKETNLIIWNYFSIPYGLLPEIIEKEWKSKTIYAVYLDWISDDWSLPIIPTPGAWGF